MEWHTFFIKQHTRKRNYFGKNSDVNFDDVNGNEACNAVVMYLVHKWLLGRQSICLVYVLYRLDRL